MRNGQLLRILLTDLFPSLWFQISGAGQATAVRVSVQDRLPEEIADELKRHLYTHLISS